MIQDAFGRFLLTFSVLVFVGSLLSLRPFEGQFVDNGPYLDGVFPEERPTIGDYKLVDAFPNLTFDGFKTDLIFIDELDRFLVTYVDGRIVSFDSDDPSGEPLVLVDFSERVLTASGSGVLSAALPNEFLDEESFQYHRIYVFYSYLPDLDNPDEYSYMRLSRFMFNEDLTSIDEASEEVLIQQFDRNSLHNGGDMFFDNEGYLFMTIGDEGKGNDGYGNSQRIDRGLFSGLIRIDPISDLSRSHAITRQPEDPAEKPENWPDSFTQGYTIPNDNPWLNDGLDEADYILEEFYAIGLRSPHRVTYDPENDEIWVADVGQASMEELTIIEKGSNAQWAYKEGLLDGPKEKPSEIIGTDTPPLWVHGRELGASIIGGVMYDGDEFEELTGKHIFGDYASRRVWAINREGEAEQLTSADKGIVEFGQDDDGNIYVVSYGGPIYKLIEKEEEDQLPIWLSETGAFEDVENLDSQEGFLPYEVNSPLWSDRAVKQRWIWLPKGKGIEFSENENWTFPKGTVFMKHFDLIVNEQTEESIRLETRFFIYAGFESYGVTYRWNEDQTDARLVEGDEAPEQLFDYIDQHGQSLEQTWGFPSQSQCLSCHNQNAGFVLGVKTSQLNRVSDFSNGQNQLTHFEDVGFFGSSFNGPLSALPKLHALNSNSVSDREKVRSYIDSNCSHCHQPDGVDADFDARLSTLFDDQGLLEEVSSISSTEGNFVVAPNDLEHSEMWVRDVSLDGNKMPPIGKNLIDSTYLEVLENWILNFACSEVTETVEVNTGDSYTFPDATEVTNITEPFTHISRLKDQNGCDSLVISNVEFFKPLDALALVNPYPNPVKETIKVDLLNPSVVRIYNLDGRLTMMQEFNAGVELYVGYLPTGMYILQVESVNATRSFRVIKE